MARKASAKPAKGGVEGATPPPNDDAVIQYNEVADRAQLNFIRLIRVDFSVAPPNAEFGEVTGADAIIPPSDDKLAYNVSAEHAYADPESGFAGAVFSCEIDAKSSEHSYFKCNADYFVGYANLQGCNIEAAEVFVKRVGKFACYPYFRSLVATLDWASEAQLPPLPVLRERLPGARGPKTRRRI